MKKERSLTRKELIKRVDRLCQTCARYRGAKKRNNKWVNNCVSCGQPVRCDQANGGHFCSRSCYPLRWDDKNVNCQCLTAESNLLVNGKSTSIANVKVGDRVAAFNEQSYFPTEAIVLSTKSFVPDELYKVELEDGSVFYATADHKIVVDGEWHTVGEMLHSGVGSDILEV